MTDILQNVRCKMPLSEIKINLVNMKSNKTATQCKRKLVKPSIAKDAEIKDSIFRKNLIKNSRMTDQKENRVEKFKVKQPKFTRENRSRPIEDNVKTRTRSEASQKLTQNNLNIAKSKKPYSDNVQVKELIQNHKIPNCASKINNKNNSPEDTDSSNSMTSHDPRIAKRLIIVLTDILSDKTKLQLLQKGCGSEDKAKNSINKNLIIPLKQCKIIYNNNSEINKQQKVVKKIESKPTHELPNVHIANRRDNEGVCKGIQYSKEDKISTIYVNTKGLDIISQKENIENKSKQKNELTNKPVAKLANCGLKREESVNKIPPLQTDDKDILLKNYNLRHVNHKNYIEESTLTLDTPDKETNNCELNKCSVPIYRRLPEQKSVKETSEDLYEFTDISPARKKIPKKREHRSSILFDKNTHDIMMKIEMKELKKKKQIIRRNRKPAPPSDYKQKVDNIVLNIMQKLGKQDSKLKEIQNLNQTNCEKAQTNTGNTEKDLNSKIGLVTVTSTPKEKDLKMFTKNISNTISPYHKQHISEEIPEPIYQDDDNDRCSTPDPQEGISSFFGFENTPIPDNPVKPINKIIVLNNVVVRHKNQDIESPVSFEVRRPNANSTMLQTVGRTSSPWRIHLKSNPHYLSVKSNALPRIEQDMVLDHTLVEEYESLCSTSLKNIEIEKKNSPVQQSILNYVESNIQEENQNFQGSLFNYECFDSPVKKKTKVFNRNNKENDVSDGHIMASTPVKRRILGNIENISHSDEILDKDITHFGFGDNSEIFAKGEAVEIGQNKKDSPAKPTRFDLSSLKIYTAKKKKTHKNEEIPVCVAHSLNESILSMQEPNEEAESGDIRLFEDPEEIVDPSEIVPKKSKRKRLDSCCSDVSDGEKKTKKPRKTKMEIEQEKWIKEFNEMCDGIDEYELELV